MPAAMSRWLKTKTAVCVLYCMLRRTVGGWGAGDGYSVSLMDLMTGKDEDLAGVRRREVGAKSEQRSYSSRGRRSTNLAGGKRAFFLFRNNINASGVLLVRIDTLVFVSSSGGITILYTPCFISSPCHFDGNNNNSVWACLTASAS